MDTKKILAVATLLVLVAGPALAWGGKQVNKDNWAVVKNDVTAVASTGGNEIVNIASGGSNNSGSNTITTGSADAVALETDVVNSNLGSRRTTQINVDNWAVVKNDVTAVVKTGKNKIVDVATGSSTSTGSNSISTGWSQAGAGDITVVNSNITRSFDLF